jgi:hypothetical protein
LLLAKLEAVAHQFRPAILAMLARSEVTLLYGALLGVTALAFEE